MNILLIGSGGREHALAWKMKQSQLCSRLLIAPGNSGTAACGENVAIRPDDFQGLKALALREQIDMLVVGPEDPLVLGIWDFFKNDPELRHIIVVGPSQEGARLEGSKAFAKAFMQEFGIPTAAYREFDAAQMEEGLAYIAAHSLPVVLKADGLAAGKGVLICTDTDEAQREFRAMLGGKFGQAGSRVVVEQFLSGIEFSVFALTDGHSWALLPEAKDYKRIGEGDTGLNTGGMGAVSPVPFVDAELMEKVKTRIIEPTVRGIAARGMAYHGFVFFGLIRVDGEPYVIEYNCRLGDPETEVVLPRLQNDLVELFVAMAEGRLVEVSISSDARAATTVVLVSGGYPEAYEKGKPIGGLEWVEGSMVFHAGMRAQEDG
ncbi:MAG: phosphoribosylamine--glycine ligase, partial [Saprospiraceae bacterium]|nr:phosphoribosylamine--glycine ligase [Saprospiraceae bacterium]